jgi:hypothetical protein
MMLVHIDESYLMISLYMIGTYLVHHWRHLLVVLLTHGLWMM